MKATLSFQKSNSRIAGLSLMLTMLLCLGLGTNAWAQTTIISDGFESGISNWTITTDNSNYTWARKSGTGYSSYSSANSGSYNAGVYYSGRPNSYTYLKLNTDLSMYSNLKLSFAYINPSWSGDIDYIYVQYSTDGSSYTNLTSYTGGASSWTTVSNLSLPSGTKYIRFAAYGDYGYGAGIDDVTVTGTSGSGGGSTVCTPTLTSSTTTYYISNFTTSGATTNINNSTSGTGYSYSNYYNSYSASAYPGTTINFTITIAGGGTHGSAIWVDWDDDGTFSSDERMWVTSGYTSSPHSNSFTVPSSATTGDHRMRIVSDYLGSVPSNPCSASTGEFEDYKLTVLSGGGGGGDETTDCEGFEGGSMPSGWTSTGAATWSVGTGDYSSSTGSNSGSYNALITHGTSGNETYLVSPTMDLSGASSASVSFSYVNRSWAGDIDYFGVYYRVNGGSWNELFSTTSAHSTWTAHTVDLEGLAANYQVGFKFTDQYGYGVGLDDICFSIIGGSTAVLPTKIKNNPTAEDEMTWNQFVDFVSSGKSYAGKTVTLEENISVSTMVGTSSTPFKGTFDGQGHTLTVNISSSEQGAAPFRYISGATIENLVVTGSVTSTAHHASGLVGFCANSSTNIIRNCLVHTNVSNSNAYNGDSGNNYMGGFIGHNQTATTTIEGCVYDGKLTSQGFKGVMFGFAESNANLTIRNSYACGTYSTNGYTSYNNFSPIGVHGSGRSVTLTFSNFYYSIDQTTFTASGYQGTANATMTGSHKHGYTITGVSPVTVAMSGTPTVYNVSGISAYTTGIVYNGHIYAGSGDQVALSLSGSPNNNYDASSGSLNGSTLTMAAANTQISVSTCPDIILGSGTTTSSYLPSQSNYNYALTQQIYTPCEIGTAGTISRISFYNGGTEKSRTYNIYLKHTDKTSFSSTTDWIAVTEADKVYSGSAAVVMAAGMWTTFTFDTPFEYNGTSNLVVVMDDNNGSYSSGMACRTYTGDGNQAIYVYSDGTNYDPTNPSSYTGTLTTSKNQVKFKICDPTPIANATISATATTGGSVSGAGTYAPCTSATVTATVTNSCYQFANWTENGTVVSTNATYSFTAAANRTLVANFEPVPWQISLASNPSNTSCIAQGTPVTLTASLTGVATTGAYNFTATTATYSSISSSYDGSYTSTGDGSQYAFSLPFDFNLAGTDFAAGTTLTMRCDGFVSFGTAYSTHSPSSPGTTYNVISPLGYDQYLESGSAMYYKVTGSTGSRVLTMEWKNMRSYYSSYNYTNYQVKIYEGSNIVELCYGNFNYAYTSTTVYIYLSSAGNITKLTSITSPTVATNTAGTTTSISIGSAAAAPANGTVYRFAPPTLGTYAWSHTGTAGTASGNTYNVTPTQSANRYTVSVTHDGCTKSTYQNVTVQDPTPTGLTFTNVAPHSATASWNSGNASSWQYSYDGGNTWTTTSSNTVNLTGLTLDTRYTFQVKTAGTSCPSEPITGEFVTACTARNLTWNGGGSTLNLQPFETTQVSASVSVGGGTISYSSDDETIATVDANGNVTALHPGTTTLYAEVAAADPYCSVIIPRTITVTACPDITLGSGSATTNGLYIPSYYSSNYSLSEQLYSPCEIGKAGTITSLSFYNNSTSSTTRKFDIYLVHTDKTAFSSTTDWIHPTAADKVYSGTANTVFEPSGWTTIYFDQPFEYNGTQFLAVIIDNNLGTTSTSAYFRTYTADGNQAIRINSSTDYDPASITSTGTTYSVKNQVMFGMCNQREASATFNIAATSNPTGGGTIEGTGSYELCQTVTLTATPDPCYRFVRWTENGTQVSTNATYTFTATKSRNLVAVFEEWGVNIVANGQTSDITVERGTEVTLTAALSPAPPITPTYTWTVDAGTEGTVGTNQNTYTVNPMELANTYTLTANVNGCRKSATRTINTTCPVPTNLQVTYTANGADITWDGDAEGYNVQYGNAAGTYTETIFSDNFENGLANWTLIDADGDGYPWMSLSNLTEYTDYYPSPSDWAHSGTDAALSGSYINGLDALSPDNYLISPQITLGGTLTFYARSLDAEYPEHFGLAVSTTTNNASAFTTIQEWDTEEDDEYHLYTVNLSNYSGQGYIAFRNFGVTDQYIVIIDDISITREVHVDATYSDIIHVDENAYSLTCLVPDATYTVQVQADCGIDLSGWSEIAVPGSPDNGGEVTIGDGTSTNSYLPTYEFYNYSLTQQIYAASEINNSGAITSLSFYVSSTNSSTRTLDLYMKHTSKSAFSSGTDWESISASDLVYRGTVSYSSAGWVTLNLSTPFNYDGTSNLLICVDDNTGDYASSNSKYVHDAPSAAIRVYSDGTNYDPFTASNYTGTVLDVKNNIKLTFNVPATSSSPGGMIASNTTTVEEVSNEEISIGEGTSTNSYLPTYEFYNYSLTQQIYTSSEIGAAGTINSISFYVSSTNSATRTLNMYMKQTSKSAFSSETDWESISASDLVYSNAVSYSSAGWVTLNLSTPFNYDGTSNLLICVDDNTGSYTSSNSKYVHDAPSAAIRIYSDGTNYDPFSASSYSGTVMDQKNNLVFSMTVHTITTVPMDVCQSEATPIVIQSIIGVSNGQYKWHRNGTELPNTNTESYTITSDELQTLTPGIYTYTRYAYNVCTETWELSEGEFSINLLAAPTAEVTVAGNEEDIICGTEAQLYVTEPDPMHIHHWYADEYCTQYIASGNELNFPALYENTTVYRVTEVLQNPCPLAAESYTLNVTPQPVPEVANEEVEAICGLPVTLSLDANSYDSRFGYEWSAYSDFRELITPNDPEGRSITVTQPTGDYTYYVRSYKRREAPTQLVYNFDWTEEVETFPVPEGTSALRLEVWGGEGGLSLGNGTIQGYGGKGGYSVGTLENPTARNLYVAVGGKGSDAVLGNGTIAITAPGGWNGGGGGTCDDDASSDSGREASGAGGGATHIATANGVLASLDNNREAVLIVAGGGGGASWSNAGGYGGGLTPGAGAGSGNKILGTFGQGANAQGMGSDDGVGGGGGGWLGGNAYDCGNCGGSNASGGSGYVNSTLLSNAATINGDLSIEEPNGEVHIGHSGNGYARITILGFNPAGCESAPAEVHLTVNAAEELTYTPSTSICGDNVTVELGNTTDGYRYDWYETPNSQYPDKENSATYTTSEPLTANFSHVVRSYPDMEEPFEACITNTPIAITLRSIVDPVVSVEGYEKEDAFYCGTPVEITVINDTADMADFDYVWFYDEACTQPYNGGTSSTSLTIGGLQNRDDRTVYVKACRLIGASAYTSNAPCQSGLVPQDITVTPIDQELTTYIYTNEQPKIDVCEAEELTLTVEFDYTNCERLADAVIDEVIEQKLVWYRFDENEDEEPVLFAVKNFDEDLDVSETEAGTYYYRAYAAAHATEDGTGMVATQTEAYTPSNTPTYGYAIAFGINTPVDITINTLNVYPAEQETEAVLYYSSTPNADPTGTDNWASAGTFTLRKDGSNPVPMTLTDGIDMEANNYYTLFIATNKPLYMEKYGADESPVRASSNDGNNVTLSNCRYWNLSSDCDQDVLFPLCSDASVVGHENEARSEFIGAIDYTVRGGLYCLTENFVEDTIIVHHPSTTPEIALVGGQNYVCHGDDPITLKATASELGDDIEYVWIKDGEAFRTSTTDTIVDEVPTDESINEVVYSVSILSPTCGETDPSASITLYVAVPPTVSDIHDTTICAPGDITGMLPQVSGGDIVRTWWESSADGETWEEISDPTQILTNLSGHILRYTAQSRCMIGYSNYVKLTVDSAAYFDELAAPEPICENTNFDWEANTATAHYVNNSGREIRTGWNLFYGRGDQVTITPETIGEFNEEFDFTYESEEGYYAYNCFIVTPCGDSIVSNTVYITVWAAPVVDELIISDEPVCAGGAIQYTIPEYTIYGDTLAYGWEMGDFPGAQHFTRLSDNVEIMDADLILDYSMNNKVLRYYVESTCGTAYSNAVTLSITDRPHLATLGEIEPVCDGTPFTLTAPAITDDGGLTVTEKGWYLLTIEAEEPVQVNANDPMTEEWNGAELYYFATNGCGTTYSDTATLTVHPAINLNAYVSLDGDTRLEEGTGCFGPDYYLIATSAIEEDITYSWSNEEEGEMVTLTRPASGDYTYTVTATVGNGCSATAEVTFTVQPVITEEVSVAICYGELPYTHGDSVFTAGGNYEIPYTTASGCDSIVNLHLTVHKATVQHTNAHICSGQTYEWPVNNTVYGEGLADTVLTDTVYIAATTWISDITSEPCDSIIHTLRLEIREGMYIDVPNDDFTAAVGETVNAVANVRMGCNPTDAKTILAYQLYKDGEAVENVSLYGTLNLGTYLPRLNTTFGTNVLEGEGNIPGNTFEIYNYAYNYFYAPFFNEVDNRIAATWNEAGEYELKLVVAEMNGGQNFEMTYRVNNTPSIMGGAGATPTGAAFTDTVSIFFHVDSELEIPAEEEPAVTYTGSIDIDTVNFYETVNETSSFTVSILGDAANEPTKLALDYEILHNDEVVASTATYGNVYFQTLIPRQGRWYGANLTNGTGSIPNNTFIVSNAEFDYFNDHFMESTDHSFTARWNQPGIYTVKFYLHERTGGQDIRVPYSNDRDKLVGGHGSSNGSLVATAEVTFHITGEPVNITVEETLCENELPFVYNGIEFNASTDAPVLIPDVNGVYDTLLTVNLTVNPIPETVEITKMVCDSYVWNDEEFTESGDYTRTFENANGCDSTVILHLTVIGQPTINISGYETVCAGTEIPVSATVTYQVGATNSTVVSFTADETSRDTNTAGTVTVVYRNNITLTESTELTVQSENIIDDNTSCMMADTFAITVLPKDSIVTLTASVCQGEPFTTLEGWNEAFVFGISGERTSAVIDDDNRVPTILNDTIVTGENACGIYRAAVILTVNPVFTEDNPLVVEGTVCENHDYADEYGFSLTADEIRELMGGVVTRATISDDENDFGSIVTVQHEGESSNGCDSVTELHLTVIPSVIEPVELTVCGRYYDPQQNEITESGYYEFVFENGAANGCDSIVALYLTVNQPSTGDTTATACESFDWYEHTGITESGDYTHTFTEGNINGCDSVVTLHLTVNHGTFNSLTETACGIYYDRFQNEYTQSGDYTVDYTNEAGCPSADTLHLTVNPTYNEIVQETVNVSELPYRWNGFTLTSSDTVTAHLETAEGCDSLITLILTVEGLEGDDPYFTTNYLGNGDTAILTAFANQTDGATKVSVNYTLTKNDQAINDMRLECGGELYIGTEWQNRLYGASLTEPIGNVPQNTFHVSNYHYDYFYFAFLDGRANTVTHSFTEPGEYKILFELVEEIGGSDFLIPYDDNSEHRIGGKNSTPRSDVLATIEVTFTVEEGEAQGDDNTTTAGPTLSLTQNGSEVTNVTGTDPVELRVNANGYANNDQVAIRYTILNENDQPLSMLSSVGTVTMKTTWNGNLNGGNLPAATGTYPGNLFRPTSSSRYNFFYLDYLTYDNIYTEINANWTVPGTYKIQLELVKMTGGQDFGFSFGNNQHIGGKNATEGGVTFDTKTLTYGANTAANPAITGIADNDEEVGITLYPNPTHSTVFVKLSANAHDGDELQLFDLYGKRLNTIAVSGEVTEIDLSTYASGMYIVKLVSNGEVTAVAKVVRQR